MRRTAAVLAAAALLLAGCSGGGGAAEQPDLAPLGDAGTDDRRIQNLYPTAEGGMQWSDTWDRGGDVLDDPWIQLGSRDVRYEIGAGGELSITGNIHRMYIRDPGLQRQWGDVEVTVYFKRGADDGIPYSGMISAVRSNHGVTAELDEAPCDSRGLYARMRNDGTVDFGKEVGHPRTVTTGGRRVWPGDLPADRWIGYKHVVYDTAEGVHQEVWMDLTQGEDGGTWIKVAEHTDPFDGGDWGADEEGCARGVDPGAPLTNDSRRAGSESGLPNISVLLRADGLWRDGLVYSMASVREIRAPER